MENSNFIKKIMEEDLASGKHKEIITRFPPEPNGYLHIGHARAIITNFELAKNFNGYTNLRFDDTNPQKEDESFVKAIIKDIAWLGYKPKKIYFASSYYNQMYKYAIRLIKKGLAYVDEQSIEEINLTRGSLTTPGINSPYRDRPIKENLSLFKQMKNGKFKEGERVLRAKINMADPNMNMRDPVIYRINYLPHHKTGKKWCIYPMYDFAHPLEDAIEGITHSLCSLEFEDHRPLYNWVIENCETKYKPRQIEFGRLNIENTILSKRYLRTLVEENYVAGWDDPRMPTVGGLKNRGYTPNAIRNFIFETGLSKTNGTVKREMLEHFVREDLKDKSEPIMVINNPLKVVITNYPSDTPEEIKVPMKTMKGERTIYFGKELYIEADDFAVEKPSKDYKRLYLGAEVRLMNAYFIKANEVIYDENNFIKEIHCTYDIKTKSGSDFKERKPNGTIHFVEATKAVRINANFFEPLLDETTFGDDYIKRFNKKSILKKVMISEPSIITFPALSRLQFIRLGYFYLISKKDNNIYVNEVCKLKSSYKENK